MFILIKRITDAKASFLKLNFKAKQSSSWITTKGRLLQFMLTSIWHNHEYVMDYNTHFVISPYTCGSPKSRSLYGTYCSALTRQVRKTSAIWVAPDKKKNHFRLPKEATPSSISYIYQWCQTNIVKGELNIIFQGGVLIYIAKIWMVNGCEKGSIVSVIYWAYHYIPFLFVFNGWFYVEWNFALAKC